MNQPPSIACCILPPRSLSKPVSVAPRCPVSTAAPGCTVLTSTGPCSLIHLGSLRWQRAACSAVSADETRHVHLAVYFPAALKRAMFMSAIGPPPALPPPPKLALRNRLIRTASLHQPTVTPYPYAALQRVYTFMREWIISPSGSLGWCARAAASSQVRLSNRSPSILCLIVPCTSVHIYNSMISLPSSARLIAFHVHA